MALSRKKLLVSFLILLTTLLCAWIVYLDITIRSTFEGKKWSIPATVYARALELYPDAPISQQDLITELTLSGYRFVEKVTKPGQASINKGSVVVYSPGFRFPDGNEPAQRISIHFSDDKIHALEAENGQSLLRLPPVIIGGIYPTHNEDRLLIKLDELPQSLLSMLVAVEDSEFYDHYGISLRGIARAVIANIKGGGISQGASTLTQQLVKNFYLSADKTFSRKAQEAIMSILLEFHFSKEEILEAYMNEIYLGQDGPRAIHGFGLASQYYFRKPITQLSLEQQAMLVTLVRGASYYNPWRHPERVKKRRNLVLDISVREGQLDPELAKIAQQSPLILGDKAKASRKRYPAYLDLVRRQLQRDYDSSVLASDGLNIFTHFDPLVQTTAENSLTSKVAQQQKTTRGKNLQGAVVVTRPNTGAVIAIVGGSNARYAGFNRALDAKRQVGSLIKPALFLSALTQHENYNLATLISDEEYQLMQDNGQLWEPENFDKQHHGDVLLYQALANSYNVSTARLGNTLGINNVINTLHKLGIEQEIQALPSVALGAVPLSVFDVAQMYQTLAADGFYTPLLSISAVVDAQGETLSSYPVVIEQRFKTEDIYMLNHALQAVTHEGTGKALRRLLPEFSVAGKTGTTNDLRDSWFAGFSGDMMAVVWLGKDDNSNSGLTGSSGALPVWASVFKEHAKLPIQNIPPETITISWVDKTTGVGSQESCDNAIPLPFIKGLEPDVEIRCSKGVDKVIDWFRDILNTQQ
ncbi:penicillin-binding protein 1B [Psychromonas sp. psych-6C06]|uniref:penicillin-binding protein 1B n=1 Tax=Psychromonas sp. psych-6C06 TaxID=2058089 RepID=UPI001EE718D9|nr:penicillin-binding protein 1B [Psychromonas sp. psych-6C06]